MSIREVFGVRSCGRKKNGSEAPQPPVIAAAAEALTRRYEELRQQVLGRRGWDRGLGLALFLRQGMRCWLESWARCLAPAPAQEGPTATLVDPVPTALQGEIATILAGMALSYRQVEVTR
jgi:hypothetical protein